MVLFPNDQAAPFLGESLASELENALTVDGVMNWLVQNADALQPSMPDHYLRSNAFYALKARGEIPVAQEVPEEPRPDFGDPSVDLGQKWVEAITLRLEAAIARWKMPK
ncbi:unnamed protein product [Durusdinium trenchii]|uniref:Uncharacterized protein n=1 Tax=Durusdinium trenchii TaxID=1381693 RepID=A0ABP0KLR5_9DINO